MRNDKIRILESSRWALTHVIRDLERTLGVVKALPITLRAVEALEAISAAERRIRSEEQTTEADCICIASRVSSPLERKVA